MHRRQRHKLATHPPPLGVNINSSPSPSRASRSPGIHHILQAKRGICKTTRNVTTLSPLLFFTSNKYKCGQRIKSSNFFNLARGGAGQGEAGDSRRGTPRRTASNCNNTVETDVAHNTQRTPAFGHPHPLAAGDLHVPQGVLWRQLDDSLQGAILLEVRRHHLVGQNRQSRRPTVPSAEQQQALDARTHWEKGGGGKGGD